MKQIVQFLDSTLENVLLIDWQDTCDRIIFITLSVFMISKQFYFQHRIFFSCMLFITIPNNHFWKYNPCSSINNTWMIFEWNIDLLPIAFHIYKITKPQLKYIISVFALDFFSIAMSKFIVKLSMLNLSLFIMATFFFA